MLSELPLAPAAPLSSPCPLSPLDENIPPLPFRVPPAAAGAPPRPMSPPFSPLPSPPGKLPPGVLVPPLPPLLVAAPLPNKMPPAPNVSLELSSFVQHESAQATSSVPETRRGLTFMRADDLFAASSAQPSARRSLCVYDDMPLVSRVRSGASEQGVVTPMLQGR